MGSESMAMRPKSKWAIDTEVMRARGIIDLFTDTAAILNLLHLSSIMGCPGGTRSVFTRAFWAKRELQCIFLRKKAIIYITSKHGTNTRSFLFPSQSFSTKT